jgi:hypothetical protein
MTTFYALTAAERSHNKRVAEYERLYNQSHGCPRVALRLLRRNKQDYPEIWFLIDRGVCSDMVVAVNAAYGMHKALHGATTVTI